MKNRYLSSPKKGDKLFNIAVVYSFIFSVCVFSLLVFSNTYSYSSCGCEGGDIALFPTVRIELLETPQGGHMVIKHISGPPVKWSNYIIIIQNSTDKDDEAVLYDFKSDLKFGEATIFAEENAPGFQDIDLKPGQTYNVKIFNVEEKIIVKERKNILCKSFALVE